jgi:alkanesulfonate monooxygenase SsuD/methylene tetrahydromethanopterin reductase-like flavin-dependent oxidoreductase (luciferase family)
MRYENPLYMAEDAGAADLIAGGRLQLGISRGSPEQVIDGWRYFGYHPAEGETDADMARRHAEVFLEVLRARASPSPTRARCSPIRRACCGSSRIRRACATASGGARPRTPPPNGRQAGHEPAKLDAVFDESGKPFHVQQAEQIRAYRAAWKEAGHTRTPRVSVSRSIFALVDDRDRAYFGGGGSEDRFRLHRAEKSAPSSAAAMPPSPTADRAAARGRGIAEADTLLLTVPEPARRRLQRPCHRGDPEACRARRWAGAEPCCWNAFAMGVLLFPEASGVTRMRLHLDDEKHETQMCLALVIAIMILTGSAILYMGTHYQVTAQTVKRTPLASPL